MAGEKFIALEETSQEIKTAVEGVSTSVTELKEDVGDGAGTDLVARVANLEAKVNSLQTTVESIPTSSDIATIVKNNAGGTVFKPKSARGSSSISSYIMVLDAGNSYKFLCASTDPEGFRIQAPHNTTATIKINGSSISVSDNGIDLPLNQVNEFTIVSGKIRVYGVGTLYEVE